MAKKNTKKGGNIKPIEEMVATQESNAEKFLDKLEKLEDKTKEEEQIVEQMDEQTVEPIEAPIDEEFVEESKKHELSKILNSNIKGAIIYNKDKSTKGVSGEQYKSIIKGYKQALGVDMNEERANYIKKLNYEQAKSIIHTINVFNKKFNSTRVLAEATN